MCSRALFIVWRFPYIFICACRGLIVTSKDHVILMQAEVSRI